MFGLEPTDEQFLLKSISVGEAVLVLGAGASFTSRNAAGKGVAQGNALAAMIATRAALAYNNETLTAVLTAVQGAILSDSALNQIYVREYRGVTPSVELTNLFKYTWRRVYTWNVDDALDNLNTKKAQPFRFLNGISDPVRENDGLDVLQVVKLHGDVGAPDKGFIMSETEYGHALADGNPWYRQAASDYIRYTPIFIGSKLKEPILSAELERAKRAANSNAAVGKAFAITPDELSPIELAGLKARGIVHVRATLSDFDHWLASNLPDGLTPRDVLGNTGEFSSRDLDALTPADFSLAHSLYPLDVRQIQTRLAATVAADHDQMARRFLRGSPPTWQVAGSDIPVWLKPTDRLLTDTIAAIDRRDRLFVVTGQAGSGKTTSLMQVLLKIKAERPDTPIYELRGEVRSVSGALKLLMRLHKSQVIVYVAELFLHSEAFATDLAGIDHGRITVVSAARMSEWRDRLERQMGAIATTHEFSRFTAADYQPLIDRLIRYVPSPAFRRKSPADRLKRLKGSNEQLLIALREATESQSFNDIITSEFDGLRDADTKLLLVICGLSTIARVGISLGSAKEAYLSLMPKRPFEEALSALDGIVLLVDGSRLVARHELYVRHIVDDLISLRDLIRCQVAVLSTFRKYENPIVKSVNRLDSTLFRFLLNNSFVYEQAKRRGNAFAGKEIYNSFEIDFQLDGHFWLQFGLFLTLCDEFDEALGMLKKSIQAYPDNAFAVHAYARLRLQVV